MRGESISVSKLRPPHRVTHIVPENYCRTCYRTIPEDRRFCSTCLYERPAGAASRIAVFLGVTAAGIYITGVLTLSARYCTIGGVLAACAAVLYFYGLVFRGGSM
jgi:predicted nucleic acid-binding Zn ribbon protein